MTKDDVLRMAREAAAGGQQIVVFTVPELEVFAKLVAAPSQRKPLTWEQISQIGLECANDRSSLPFEVKLARAIEAAHDIKREA